MNFDASMTDSDFSALKDAAPVREEEARDYLQAMAARLLRRPVVLWKDGDTINGYRDRIPPEEFDLFLMDIVGASGKVGPLPYLRFVSTLARTFRREELEGVDATDFELELLALVPPAAARALLGQLRTSCMPALYTAVFAAQAAQERGEPEEAIVSSALTFYAWIAKQEGAMDARGRSTHPATELCHGVRRFRLLQWLKVLDALSSDEVDAMNNDEERLYELSTAPLAARRALLPLARQISVPTLQGAVKAAKTAAKRGLPAKRIVERALVEARKPAIPELSLFYR